MDEDSIKRRLQQQSPSPNGSGEDDDREKTHYSEVVESRNCITISKEPAKNETDKRTLSEGGEEEESGAETQLKQAPQLANHSCCHKKQQQEVQSRTGESLVTTQPTPVDWEPQDKCYFCDKGKLLAVNDRGELIAESGVSADLEPELIINTVSFPFGC